MLAINRNRTFGVLSALFVGGLVFFMGYRLLSPAPSPNSATSARKNDTPALDARHETLMLSEALKKKPQHAPVLFRMAQLSEQAGKYAEAAGQLREVLQSEPENMDAMLELGRALFYLGDVQGALDQTNSILKRQPDHADALFNLGAIYANLGNFDLARSNWNKLLTTSPHAEIAQQARTMLSKLPAMTSAGQEEGSLAAKR